MNLEDDNTVGSEGATNSPDEEVAESSCGSGGKRTDSVSSAKPKSEISHEEAIIAETDSVSDCGLFKKSLSVVTAVPFTGMHGSEDDCQEKETIHATSKNNFRVVELKPPVPFVVPEFEDDDLRREKATDAASSNNDQAVELIPPVPYVVPEFEDDDLRRKKATDAASSNNDQAVELRPPVPFVVPEFEDNDVRNNFAAHQESTDSCTRVDDEMPIYSEQETTNGFPNDHVRDEESPHVNVDGDVTHTSGDADNLSEDAPRRTIGTIFASVTNRLTLVIPVAFLVQSQRRSDETIYIATIALPWWKRKWALVLLATICVSATSLAVVLPLALSPPPSPAPTSSPTFDPGPTLQQVRRRKVRCGLETEISSPIESVFNRRLCRSIASVIFGDPEMHETVPVKIDTRFQQLVDRKVDLLLNGDTHTIEREFKERTTGEGFTFSSPYRYDGVTYFGNETFVKCAENRIRVDECSNLSVCVIAKSSFSDQIVDSFPSDFVVEASSSIEMNKKFAIGACNVIANNRATLMDSYFLLNQSENVFGTRTFSKEPTSIVTRKNDYEWSDIINWVVQALYYGEQQGLTKDLSLCQNYTNLASAVDVSDLVFLNAVYCADSFHLGDIFSGSTTEENEMNHINNGTTGMIYATPFHEVSDKNDIASVSFTLSRIRNAISLNCGVVVPHGFAANISNSAELNGTGMIGMSVDYCRAIAAALFNGKSAAVKLYSFVENDESAFEAFEALDNGTIDVLAGGRVERKYDFKSSSLPGFHFSTPYYYNRTAENGVSFYSLATREDEEDNAMFSSFVNCVVLATIYAQEVNIDKEESGSMPLSNIFGEDFSFALKDAISYSGSYDEIFAKNFGDIPEEDRGWNRVNDKGPLLYPFPGLDP